MKGVEGRKECKWKKNKKRMGRQNGRKRDRKNE